MRLHPFRALRPIAELAPRVAAPAYDVVSREEATRLAAGNPLSFLHVSRSEIDLPEDVDPHDARVYARARESLDRLVADGALLREPSASLYLYRQVMDGRAPAGVRPAVWRLAEPAAWVTAFGAVTRAYVADGHHRSASAWRAARERRVANPHHRGDEEYNWFLAALVPAAELRILPYNRVASDLKGQTGQEVLEQLGRLGRLSPTSNP